MNDQDKQIESLTRQLAESKDSLRKANLDCASFAARCYLALPIASPETRPQPYHSIARPESPLSTKTNKLTMTPAALSALAKGDLENFMAASIPGGIERQEKQGQITESFRETLPIDGTIKSRRGEDNKAQFESVGFVFGAPADDLFVNVKFPEGWKKVPTEHSMWTDIVDHKGRKRGAIFYKAAFYDRSAHCHLTRRFDVTQTYGDGTTNETAYIADACGEVNQRIEDLKRPDYNDRAEAQRRNAAMDEAKTKLRAWLKENFPNYESPTAYWE